MDYKEKLKAIINSNETPFVDIDTFLKYFPELKESEDEKIRKAIIQLVKKAGKGYENVTDGVSIMNAISWLEKQGEKGTKRNNGEIPNSAWSDEDERRINHIIAFMSDEERIKDTERLFPIEEDINWLKSLKERYTWKPSKEQMNTLEYYMHTLVCNEYKKILFGLYADLKKLMEE